MCKFTRELYHLLLLPVMLFVGIHINTSNGGILDWAILFVLVVVEYILA